MPKKQRKFADDGWAVWVDGDDTSTVYINDWLNPKGKSYIDMSIRIRGVKASRALHVYVPFSVSREEIEDVSLLFDNTKILQAIFSAACLVDYKKNDHTSEAAYNGKTIDIVHLSTLDYELKSMSDGTLLTVDLDALQPFLDNDEAYFSWRMPHKTLDEVFKPKVDVKGVIGRIRDLITTPVVSEKYGYSVRINESSLLPEDVTRIGAFHRQKLKKAVITLAIDEDYELNDSGCYRIRRMEENLYKAYLPADYKCGDVITYQWNQTREYNTQGQFNFYYNITKESINSRSMTLYMVVLMLIAIAGEILGDIAKTLLGLQ